MSGTGTWGSTPGLLGSCGGAGGPWLGTWWVQGRQSPRKSSGPRHEASPVGCPCHLQSLAPSGRDGRDASLGPWPLTRPCNWSQEAEQDGLGGPPEHPWGPGGSGCPTTWCCRGCPAPPTWVAPPPAKHTANQRPSWTEAQVCRVPRVIRSCRRRSVHVRGFFQQPMEAPVVGQLIRPPRAVSLAPGTVPGTWQEPNKHLLSE